MLIGGLRLSLHRKNNEGHVGFPLTKCTVTRETMKFAKLFQNLTACLLALWLSGCATQSPPEQAGFNRSEAVKARINLALAYLEQNDFPKAKQNIDKALEHGPKDYLPHSVLAYYFQQIGEPSNAEKAYQQALTLSENRPDVMNNYGTFLCKQGKFDAAYQQFEQALQSKQPYYYQADTLENIVLCADKQPNLNRKNDALAQLEKWDSERARKLK